MLFYKNLYSKKIKYLIMYNKLGDTIDANKTRD